MLFLFICFTIFMLIPLLLRVFVGSLFGRRRNVYSEPQTTQQSYKKEGEVYVSSTVEQEKMVEKDMGEYVEFETVKED